jgi:hypothetical protein
MPWRSERSALCRFFNFPSAGEKLMNEEKAEKRFPCARPGMMRWKILDAFFAVLCMSLKSLQMLFSFATTMSFQLKFQLFSSDESEARRGWEANKNAIIRHSSCSPSSWRALF